MLPAARWSLRLPRQYIRSIRTRNIPGPRGHIQKPSLNRPKPSEPSSSLRKQSPSPAKAAEDATASLEPPSKVQAVADSLAAIPDSENDLVTPVYIPEDPSGVLKETHPAMRLLDNSAIVVQRQLEMMNVLMGFEQANRYVIMDPHGNHIGYLAEQEHGLGNVMARQMFRTHRSFTTHVFDREEREVLRFHRPFSWINSRIRIYDAAGTTGGMYSSSSALDATSVRSLTNQTSASVSSRPLSDMRIIGSAEQEWAPLRRKYNLFLARNLEDELPAIKAPQSSSDELPLSNSSALTVVESDSREVGMLQFARVDEPFLSWDFSLTSEDGHLIGSVNRNFVGFAREIFTDTGVYALRMDSAGLAAEPSHLISQTGEQAVSSSKGYPGMTLDQRAVMLSTAVSIDFDYFSRHSGSGGLWPMWVPWVGGEAVGGAAAGEAGAAGAGAGAVGAASEAGIASEAGAAARGLGSTEGWAAGAGTMAGYEAMQRTREARQQQQQEIDEQPSQSHNESLRSPDQSQGMGASDEGVWGQGGNPWGNDRNQDYWGGRRTRWPNRRL